jgi:hypothetical protein
MGGPAACMWESRKECKALVALLALPEKINNIKVDHKGNVMKI